MAGLPTQNVPIPFAQGVTTKVDAKQAPLGKLLTLENGIFQTPMEIRKRYGFTALSQSILGGGTLSSCGGYFGFNDEILQYSPTNATAARAGMMYGYDQANSAWSSVGAFQPAKLTTVPGSTGEINQVRNDSAYDSATGLRCFTWVQEDTIDLYSSIYDTATGKLVFSGRIATAIQPTDITFANTRVVTFNGNFVIIYINSSSLVYARILTTAPTSVAGTGTIDASPDGAWHFDAVVLGSRLYVAYGNMSARYLDTSFTVSAETTSPVGGGVTPQCISICANSSNQLGLALGTDDLTYGAVFDANLAIVLASTSLAGGISNINQIGICALSMTFQVYACRFNSSLYYARFTSAGLTTAMTITMRETNLVGKPFVYENKIFFFVHPAVSVQPTLFLLEHYANCDDTYPLAVVGKIAYSAYGIGAVRNVLPVASEISAGIFQIAYAQQTGIQRVDLAADAVTSPMVTWACLIDLTVTPSSAQIAQGLHLSGGQLWLYDGQNIVEHGFHFYPKIAASSAGGGFPAGSYQYVAVYEWVDGQGQVHRSAPSKPVGSAGGTVTLTTTTLKLTNKRGITTTGTVRPTNKVKICIYRTTDLGTIFYFTGSVDNDITATTVAFVDTHTDASIIDNLQLYTTGGTVDNIAAPATLAVTTFKSRLIVIPSDNQYSWWFSQEVIPDSEATLSTPAEMSDIFIQNIDQKGGPLTGCISMDDKLILMKKGLPYYVVGNGPAQNGANNDYSPPQEITAPVGTLLHNSLVLTPMGVMFQAANSAGLWLLDRGLNTSYIGADVEAYNSQNVTSAVLYPQYNQIRFTMSGGVCLGFDYFVNQWTVLTNIAAVQALIWRGTYSYMRSNGLGLQESTATFTDNGTFVQLKLATTWMKMAGLQGFQRIYEAQILGDYETAHALIAKVYYDFTDTPEQTTTITPSVIAPYQWRLQFKRQKCEAMKIELYDTQISPAEGMRLSALTLIAGIKYGANKMAASRTFD